MKKDFVISVIKDGQLTNPAPLRKLFTGLKDGRYEVSVKRLNRRSLPQNAYYWAVAVPLIQQGIEDLGTELTKEETHEFLKSRFNFVELASKEGEYLQVPKSTTGLTKTEFAEYIAKIQQFAVEFLGIVIPDPGSQLDMYE